MWVIGLLWRNLFKYISLNLCTAGEIRFVMCILNTVRNWGNFQISSSVRNTYSGLGKIMLRKGFEVSIQCRDFYVPLYSLYPPACPFQHPHVPLYVLLYALLSHLLNVPSMSALRSLFVLSLCPHVPSFVPPCPHLCLHYAPSYFESRFESFESFDIWCGYWAV